MTEPTNRITTVATGHWDGVLAVADTPSNINTIFTRTQGRRPQTRKLPMSLLWQDNSDPDNPTVHVVGCVTAVTFNGQQIHATGVLDLTNPATQRLLAAAGGAPVPVAMMIDRMKLHRNDDTGQLTYTSWRITGALITDQPQWPEAVITLSTPQA